VGITGWFLGGVLLGLLAALIAEPGPAAEPVGYVRKSAPSPSGTVLARSTAVLQGDPSERDATAPEGAPQSLESLAPTPSAPDLPAAAWDAGPALAEAGPGPAQASGNAPWSHPDPDSTSACPAGMLLVQGDWCPYLTERCVDWIDQKRDRCRRYAKPTVCHGRRVSKRFCIDRYEYPNEKGVLPAVMVDWLEARDACKAEGKRLCTEDEWTFACEGTEELPYPYGYVRNPEACNIDRPTVTPDFKAFTEDRIVADEVFRLDQRVPSGSMDRCVSPFGVHDMTGNVDEWVVNEKGKPHRSGLKGGYFGKIRARCRPMTTDHNEWFRFYQAGFRCCSAARPAPAARVAPGVPAAASPVLP
jgi:hypothetical protein